MTVVKIGYQSATAGSNFTLDTPANSVAADPGIYVDTANASHGTKSLRYDLAGSYQYVQKNIAAQTDGTVGVDFFPSVTPTTQSDFLQLFSSTTSVASTDRFAVRYLSSKQFRIIDTTGATVLTTAKSGGYTLSAHTRVTVKWVCGTGAVEVRTYEGADTTTATETLTGTGTLPPSIVSIRWGRQVSGASGSGYIWLGDPMYGTSQADWPLPTGSSASPAVAVVGADQTVEPFTPVTIDATGSIGATTLSIAAVSNTSATTPTLANPSTGVWTFTAPGDFYAGSVLKYRVTATNADGSSTDDVTFTVRPATIGIVQAGGAIQAARLTVV